jgi:peptide methionine sulfoxide reductase MsrA
VSFAASTEVAGSQTAVPVYFGVGCFWHVQHEFVQAEKNMGRSDDQITSRAGYAGGNSVAGNVYQSINTAR